MTRSPSLSSRSSSTMRMVLVSAMRTVLYQANCTFGSRDKSMNHSSPRALSQGQACAAGRLRPAGASLPRPDDAGQASLVLLERVLDPEPHLHPGVNVEGLGDVETEQGPFEEDEPGPCR